MQSYQSTPYLAVHLSEVLGNGRPVSVFQELSCCCGSAEQQSCDSRPPPPPTSIASACDLVSHHTKVIRMWERMDACTGLWKTDRFISARTSAVHNGPKIDDKLQFNDYARRCVKYLSAVYTCVNVIKDSTRRANNIHLWKKFLTSDDSVIRPCF